MTLKKKTNTKLTKKGLTFCIFSKQKRRHCRQRRVGARNACWPGCILAPAIKVIARRYTHTSPAIGHAQTSFTLSCIFKGHHYEMVSVLKLSSDGQKISKHQRLKQLLEIDLGHCKLCAARCLRRSAPPRHNAHCWFSRILIMIYWLYLFCIEFKALKILEGKTF